MAQYKAWIQHAETGGENTYIFDGRDDLMADTPVRIVRAFMEVVDRKLLPEAHIDYEINAAMKNAEKGVVTSLGAIHLEKGGSIPYLLMISQVPPA